MSFKPPQHFYILADHLPSMHSPKHTSAGTCCQHDSLSLSMQVGTRAALLETAKTIRPSYCGGLVKGKKIAYYIACFTNSMN